MTTLLLNIDQTLLHSYSLFYPLASLKPEDALRLCPDPPVLLLDPAEWHASVSRLHRAYLAFVSLVAQEETSDEPLGLFRPGLFSILTRIQRMYHHGIIQRVILYSSHPFQPLTTFARDVIQSVLLMDASSPHSSSSSPSSCSLLPIETAPHGLTSLGDIDRTANLFLIDDQPLPASSPVNGHALCLPPYTFRASFSRVGELYLQALRTAKVALHQAHDINWFLFSTSTTLTSPPVYKTIEETLLGFLEQRTGPTAPLSQPPPKGNGILSVLPFLEKMRTQPNPSQEDGLNQKHIRPSE